MFAPRHFALRHFARRHFPVGGATPAATTGTDVTAHRFRTPSVPASFADLEEVQRFLVRAFDEVARAANPVRTVPDGGTGIAALERGEVLAGGGRPDAFTRIPGNRTTTRQFLCSQGTGIEPGVPFWTALATTDPPPPPTGDRVLVGALLVKVGANQIVP